jgi:threonyl-tRNA synthetase
VLVVGNDDVAAGTVGVNRRGSTDNKPELGVPMADFVAEVVAEVDRKGLPEDKVAQSEAQVEGEVAAG